MNEIIKKMITRHAIRRYQGKQLDEETLEQILLAGLYAPSGGNNQRSRIVVCQNQEINERLGKLSRYMQFKDEDPAKIAQSISADQPSIKDDLTIMDGFYHAPLQEDGFVDKSLVVNNYPQKDFHEMYVGEILKVLVKEEKSAG